MGEVERIAEVKRLKSLAADHFRNSRRLAHRLVIAEDELRRLKSRTHLKGETNG